MFRAWKPVAFLSCNHASIQAWSFPTASQHNHEPAGTSPRTKPSIRRQRISAVNYSKGRAEMCWYDLNSLNGHTPPRETCRVVTLRTALVVRNATAYPRDSP